MDEKYYPKMFVGSSSKCQYGPVIASNFQQPVEVVCQFDEVIYLCGAQRNSFNIITEWNFVLTSYN